MSKGQHNNPQPVPDMANLDQSELVSNQEAKVIPWFCGRRKFPLIWICEATNLFTTDADASGKK